MSSPGPLRRLRDRVARGLGSGPSRSDGRPRAPRDSGTGDAGTGGIAVSYAPHHDGDADPGEVVWAWVPYEEDPARGKDRPVLVLGHDGDRLAGVQLSSRDHADRADAHEWVPVGTGAWDREARPSYADASRLLRLDARSVRREGAALAEARFRAVLARVTELHDWSG